MRYSISCRTAENGDEKCLVVRDGVVVPPGEELSRDKAQVRADKLNSNLLCQLLAEAQKKNETERITKLREELHTVKARIKARDSGRGGI